MESNTRMNWDVIVFAAHPDDAELSMGGTIAKLSKAGKKVAIVDFCRGELGSRGTPDIRKQEAVRSAEILAVSIRENLGFTDGSIKFNDEYLRRTVEMIRYYRPKIIFAPYKNDRHPDHIGASEIVKNAYFFSGTQKYTTQYKEKPQHDFRPDKLYYYAQTFEFKPSFIVDISETFTVKMAALCAYSSQFHNEDAEEPETFISKPGYIKYLEARAQVYGFKIGKDYGEAFYCEEEIELDLMAML